MVKHRIPFNKPYMSGKELDYIRQSVLNNHISGDGPFTKKCHEFMEKSLMAKKVLLTVSCTAALEMAAMLCGIKDSDEVIMPSFAHPSTANAFYIRGARPVFVDIRPDTSNIDERKIEDAVTVRTKAIVVVHYAGIGCDMDAITDIAKRHNLFIVEDAAQGFYAEYKGRFLGTIGDIGAFSFHETKNIICGEGGAIVINNEAFFEAAEIIRDKGTDRSKFFRGEVDKYRWVQKGSSYLPSDLLAAYLYAQIENKDRILERRKQIYDFYLRHIEPMAKEGFLSLPVTPYHCKGNGQLFHILLNDEAERDALIIYLEARGISAVFHFLPLHLSPVGMTLGYHEGMLPVTESVSNRLLRLPFFYEIKQHEQEMVVDAIRTFFAKRAQKP